MLTEKINHKAASSADAAQDRGAPIQPAITGIGLMIDFTPWPDDLAAHYRRMGYWAGRPLFAGMQAQAARRPDAPAIVCAGQTISYGALDRRSSALAAALARRGLGRGDTALVQLPNVAAFHVTFLALLKAGIVPVNALYSHRRLELTAYAAQIAPRLVIADRAHPLFGDDDLLSALGADHALMLGGDGPEDLAAAMLGDPALPAGTGPTAPDTPAFFQLSGGSTGTPKLIPRTHDDYDYSVRESARICGVTHDTCLLIALPAPHNYLLSSPGALGVFHAGGTVVIAPSPDPAVCLPLIARHRVTMAALVPSVVGPWLDAAPRHAGALDSLDVVLVGGAAFPEATARRVPAELGCRLQQVFGMAEGLVNYTRPDDPPETVFTTQGRPISPDDEIRILDPDTLADAGDGPGLLATRGPYTVRGYHRAPDHNAAAFTPDGFYLTGDLVERAGRNLRVVGRVKDQINRGGEKIASEEIEALLHRHPAVRAAALVAVPDEAMGEKSCAFVVSARAIRPTDLRRHLMDMGIADYKLPDRFRFLDSLPLTPVGKPDKARLRLMLTKETCA